MKLRELRERADLSVPYVAFMLDMSDDDYRRFERGEEDTYATDVYMLSSLFGCSVEEVLRAIVNKDQLDQRLKEAPLKNMPEFLKRCAQHGLRKFLSGARPKDFPVGMPDENRMTSSGMITDEDLYLASDMMLLVIQSSMGSAKEPEVMETLFDFLHDEAAVNQIVSGKKKNIRSCEIPQMIWYLYGQILHDYRMVKDKAGASENTIVRQEKKPVDTVPAKESDFAPSAKDDGTAFGDIEDPDEFFGIASHDLSPIDETADYYGSMS